MVREEACQGKRLAEMVEKSRPPPLPKHSRPRSLPIKGHERHRGPMAVVCPSSTPRVASRGPSIGLWAKEGKACWVPTVNEELGPPVTADLSARWNWGTEERLCQLYQLLEFVQKPTDATCWESGVDKTLGRALLLVVEGSACSTSTAKGGVDQLGCRSSSGTNCSVVASEARVLVAVFERAACCSVESPGGVARRKRALIISLRCACK